MLWRSYVIPRARGCVMLCPWFHASRRPRIRSLPCTSTPLSCGFTRRYEVVNWALLLLVTCDFLVFSLMSSHYKGCSPTQEECFHDFTENMKEKSLMWLNLPLKHIIITLTVPNYHRIERGLMLWTLDCCLCSQLVQRSGPSAVTYPCHICCSYVTCRCEQVKPAQQHSFNF